MDIDCVPPLSRALKVTTLPVSPWLTTGGTVVVLPIAWLCLSVVGRDCQSVPDYRLAFTVRGCDVASRNCGAMTIHRGLRILGGEARQYSYV